MPTDSKKVYCFQLGARDCYRIGRTKSTPQKRMRQFATGSPEPFSLYKVIESEHASSLEAYIHKLLDERRTANGDFFNVTAHELDEAVEQAKAFVDVLEPLRSEANKLRRKRPSGSIVDASAGMLVVYRKLRKLNRERYLIERQIEFLESEVQVAIGDGCGMKGVASWKWKNFVTIDLPRFKREQKELYEKYKRDSGYRVFRLEKIDLTRGD